MSLPLRSERLVVREFADDDAPGLARAFADPEVIWWEKLGMTVEREVVHAGLPHDLWVLDIAA